MDRKIEYISDHREGEYAHYFDIYVNFYSFDSSASMARYDIEICYDQQKQTYIKMVDLLPEEQKEVEKLVKRTARDFTEDDFYE